MSIFSRFIKYIKSLYAKDAEPDVPQTSDEVSYRDYSFSYGGFHAPGAELLPAAQISGLKLTSNGLSYSWKSGGCESFGASSKSDASRTVCLFEVQLADGSWKGGKFDWISTSRTTRGFENIFNGYSGWTLNGVPNPCNASFCIVGADGRNRTNTLSGTWKRS